MERAMLWIVIVLLFCPTFPAERIYTSKKQITDLREQVRGMFEHAYEGYLTYAKGYDELRPLTCDGVDTWTRGHLTLIDALDTLAVMGNFTEFRRVAKLVEAVSFDKDINVSVFETNIRVLGGLISAHLMMQRAGIAEDGWPCNGSLLRLAEDVASRLLPAFDTATGMPYGTVNLRYGVPNGETAITCTAGVGTFLVEFGALTRLTGNPVYEEVALNAVYALWERRSPIGLFGNHIDVQTGRWTALDAGIGAGVDSFFEYLVKGAILLNRPELLEMFNEARQSIDKYLKRDEWFIWANMNKGSVTLPVFQSLEAFWPGLLSLAGHTAAAVRSVTKYSSVWQKYGFLPEFYNIPNGEASPNRESYPLRPELVESLMYLYRSSKNPLMLEMGENMLNSIEFSAKTKCGYATIRNVVTHEKENRMESFFLAETTKYLYLLFDEDNFLHNDGGSGERWRTAHGECVIHTGPYIFNTEAHPIDLSALHCCHNIKEDPYDGLDLDMFRDSVILQEERQQREKAEQLRENKCAPTQANTAARPLADGTTTEKDKSQIAVDIEVFDEDNKPAGDILVESFERIKSERGTGTGSSDSDALRNQLTVTDLEEFFAMRREDLPDDDAGKLDFVQRFMVHFTLDATFIAGLQVLDKNLTSVLGTVIQKEFEGRMRSLWELYELQAKYRANAHLVKQLGLLAFDDQNRDYLEHVSLALASAKEFAELPATHNATSLAVIMHQIDASRDHFQEAMVNTTAMQEFLLKILQNGTLEKKRQYQPILEATQIASLQAGVAPSPANGELFTNARRVVELKRRMIETFERMQALMDASGSVKQPATAGDATLISKSDEETTPRPRLVKSDNSTLAAAKEAVDASGGANPVQESVWSQLVQAILRKTNTVPRAKFDEALLLQKTRQSLEKHTARTRAAAPKYELFTCPSPKFIDRFAYRDFVP